MSDTIYREQAIAEMHLAFGAKPAVHAKAINVLNSLPSAEKKGKWIEYPIADGMNQCSACGVLRFGESNYCPNCGARMVNENEK